ncbi:BTAD domain-containing putative transcriptional regulator, partial [Saccharothrix longispora]|uniref:AfsR/SARP family transcriptional regulator n=1 Tax=Saccharothrix longispora TaxID=33920 RepID=UPI0028FD8C52
PHVVPDDTDPTPSVALPTDRRERAATTGHGTLTAAHETGEPVEDTDFERTAADGDARRQGAHALEILGPTPPSPPGSRSRADSHVRPRTESLLDPTRPATVPALDDPTGHEPPPGTTEPGRDVPLVPLRIDVLGPPRVWWRPAAVPDGEAVERDVTPAFQPRQRELLVFLALHPDGTSREALIAALWATSPPEKTTNAMNTGLSRLRRAVTTATEGTLTDVVLAGESRYRLDPRLVRADYHHFAAAVAARRTATTDRDRIEAYRRIIDSYTGPLADGLSTEWIETAREAIRRDALDAVSALARALVEHDPQQTLDLLEIARAFDPHNELIYRDIMRLQERLGQLDAIPRTLTLLTTRLAELDDMPTSQTIDLADRLRRRHDIADQPGPPTRADHGYSRTA